MSRGGDKTERPWDRFAPPGFESVQPPCILLQLHDASFHCWRHCSGGGKTERKKTREFCMIFYICTVLLNTYLLKFYLHKGKPLLTIPDRLMNNGHSTFLVKSLTCFNDEIHLPSWFLSSEIENISSTD